MSSDRSWMLNPRDETGLLPDRFIQGVDVFFDFAFSQPGVRKKARCPCRYCRNTEFREREDIKYHLYNNGFVSGYSHWDAHGEPFIRVYLEMKEDEQSTRDHDPETMVMDAMGPEIYEEYQARHDHVGEQVPNPKAAEFFRLLEEADRPLWPGCVTQTKLSAASQLLNCKSEFNMSGACFDRLTSIIQSMLPENNKLEGSFYKTKKMLSSLGLGVKKIDACINDCHLYYAENENLTECPTCKHPPFREKRGKRVSNKVLRHLPLAPRLQRLFMSRHTSEHMIWHSKNGFTHGEMSHPVHSEAWKHFDRTYPHFGLDPRGVRLGLCTDGFCPFNMGGSKYSCWPVIITVYNLPPWMCMQQNNMLLSMVIPRPKSPGKNLDVYLRPLIDELKILWCEGVETFDIHKNQNFMMRAALMWTISDFPAYGMLSGWSTHGRLSCPYCMESTKSFRLKFGQKTSLFDCHRQFLPCEHPFRRQRDKFFKGRIEKDVVTSRLSGEHMRNIVDKLPNIVSGPSMKEPQIDGFGQTHNWVRRSIFWELPYWHTNLIRHNLDVMHIEKNFFDNVFNTVMDIKDKTKDNIKSRKDLEIYCKRPQLHISKDESGKSYKPHASYSLKKEQKREVFRWMRNLKLPDGYASNIARCIKDDSELFGMKSHDCHVFMQRLIPIAFKDALPKPIWEALTEVSHFFRDICSTTVKVKDMERLEENIIVTLCKLEKIFPPSFFYSMEHLPVHLAYEAKVGGPVQYRWMYPFERFLHHLKKKVTNRARVEASIVEAYLIEETSNFCALYFDHSIKTRLNHAPRNDDGGCVDALGRLSVFAQPGRPIGSQSINFRFLTSEELKAATLYVLLNCQEIAPFIAEFDKVVRKDYHYVSEAELDQIREIHFPRWLREFVSDEKKEVDNRIRDMALGPSRKVRSYNGYYVNGYKFHTHSYGLNKATQNSGVCVLGSCYNEFEVDLLEAW